jgi:hypothetical protein
MTAKRVGISEEEVLLAFAVEPIHDRKTLESYLGEYPEHAKALVDYSVELMVDATRGDEVSLTSEAVVDRAWQQFQAAVRPPVDSAAVNPFARLNPTAIRSLAERLNINKLLLTRVRDRAIDAATIPRRFVQSLATELGAPADAVMAYLSSPPAIVSSHSFRSAVKPTVAKQISFEKAVESSQLTVAQQNALKALKE